MRKIEMKTQTKTTLLLISPFLLIILTFSVFIYLSLSSFSKNYFFELLEIRALTVAKVSLENQKNPVEIAKLTKDFTEKLPYENDYYFKIVPGEDYSDEAEKVGVPTSFFTRILNEKKADYEKNNIYYKGIIYKTNGQSYIVIASAENYFKSQYDSILKNTLLFAIFAALFFTLFISIFFTKYIFKPIAQITEKVKEISSESLNLRLSEVNKNKELNDLTNTFNDMLDRIETSFETQNNFISNASHELRTPLTAIIGEADVALSKIRKTEEYIESLAIILDEAEKLDRKTKALLFLAQTGFKGTSLKFEKVRMDQLIWDVTETLEKINPKSKITVDTTLLPEDPLKLKVKGNEQLLHLAFTNILSNACKYSNYQNVMVSIGSSNDKVFIIIRDFGIGIPTKEIKYIYDPFFRASNTKNFEGYGIGLPLTQNIIRMHHGEILVSSAENEGTTVEIKLPIGHFESF